MPHKIAHAYCVKQSSLKSIPAIFNDCICDLFIVIAKDTLIGNYSLLNSNGLFDDKSGIRGISVSGVYKG